MDWTSFTSIREIQVLVALPLHRNVIRLHDVIFSPQGEYYLVFEYAEQQSLDDLLRRLQQQQSKSQDSSNSVRRTPLLPDQMIRSILYDALQGLHHIHTHGFFHRDIKPANLLLSRGICKVSDFSFARRFPSHAEIVAGLSDLTQYVATRWYRSPELIMESPSYGAPVDIFALGCVAAELYHPHGWPLFAGSSDVDQLSRIFKGLGTPNVETWPEGMQLQQNMNVSFPSMPGKLLDILPDYLTKTTQDWLSKLLTLCPERRPTTKKAMDHAFFQVTSGIIHENEDSFRSEDTDFPSPTSIILPGDSGLGHKSQTTLKRKTLIANPYLKKKTVD